jgi:hypothetical protein
MLQNKQLDERKTWAMNTEKLVRKRIWQQQHAKHMLLLDIGQ